MAPETVSQRILRENRVLFQQMLDHRFVRDIATDRLPQGVFDRYLVYEGAFVDTAISIFALAVSKAETMAQKRWLIGVLDALANQQIAYFERVNVARGIDPARFDLNRARIAAFRDGMLDIARFGSFAEIVTAMFAAEWMYWAWCRAIAPSPPSDPLLAEWVALHATPEFAAQAEWLRAELDQIGTGLDGAAQARLGAIFGQVMRLEIAFHDAAYDGGDAP